MWQAGVVSTWQAGVVSTWQAGVVSTWHLSAITKRMVTTACVMTRTAIGSASVVYPNADENSVRVSMYCRLRSGANQTASTALADGAAISRKLTTCDLGAISSPRARAISERSRRDLGAISAVSRQSGS